MEIIEKENEKKNEEKTAQKEVESTQIVVDLKEENNPSKEIKNTSNGDNSKQQQKQSRKQQIIEFLKFLGFSISAGVIQLASFELMYDLIKWKVWWACYLISIVLSVLWNFTFNRKFTFKSASNVPLAMTFAFLFYCAFTPASLFGGNALEGAGWNGTLVEAMMMVINFALEFVWDKFVVFNDKFMSKLIGLTKKHKKVSAESGEILGENVTENSIEEP